MFQNAAIDVATGLVLMFLVLSLVCTVVNEFIASKLRLRSKSLAGGLKELLDDPAVRRAFYSHGLVSGVVGAVRQAAPLVRAPPPPMPAPAAPAAGPPGAAAAAPAVVAQAPDNHPSYIAAETFVLALVGSLGAAPAPGATVPGLDQVAQAINGLPASKMKDALQASLTAAQGNFETFRTSVSNWFDNSMDRLSGAYKRNLKFISISIGCFVAILINADTLVVGRALWSDAALRAQVVQAAGAMVQSKTTASSPGSTTAPSTPAGTTSPSVDDVVKALQKAESDLRPLPVGWSSCSAKPSAGTIATTASGAVSACIPSNWFPFIPFKIFGCFVTGLALSLGAPFWFDLLSKFMNLRGTGAKPERKDK